MWCRGFAVHCFLSPSLPLSLSPPPPSHLRYASNPMLRADKNRYTSTPTAKRWATIAPADAARELIVLARSLALVIGESRRRARAESARATEISAVLEDRSLASRGGNGIPKRPLVRFQLALDQPRVTRVPAEGSEGEREVRSWAREVRIERPLTYFPLQSRRSRRPRRETRPA